MSCFAGCFGGVTDLKLKTPKKFVYFGLATPVALPSMILMEMSGKPYEGKIVEVGEWPELKKTVPHGKLPYAEMPDGSSLVESGAIGRTIAGSCGQLGVGEDFSASEMVVGLAADLHTLVSGLSPTVFTVNHYDDDKYAKYMEKGDDVKAFAAKIGKFLKPSGDRFTKSGVTFGEIDLFCKMYCYKNGPFKNFGEGVLDKFYERMLKVPAVQKVVNGDSKFGKLGTYMIAPPQMQG
jgi:hypothetical protein